MDNIKHSHNFIDLVGKQFGRLTVMECVGKNKHGNLLWKCLCVCGQTKIIVGYSLSNGSTVSCGCYGKEIRDKAHIGNTYRRQSYGESSFRALFRIYRRAAKSRGFDFVLSERIFKEITQQKCYYCGKTAQQVYTRDDLYGEYVYNGIDRFHNSLGYTVENSVSCCEECNFAKGTMDGHEYLELCRRVASHWSNREMERVA